MAYKKALACDPVSAFGSVIAFTVPVDDETANAVSSLFVECIVAPSFSDGAVEILGRKKNLRVLEGRASWGRGAGTNTLDYKRVRGGVLVQERAARPSMTTGGRSSRSASRPRRSAAICCSPGAPWRRSSRTRSSSRATARRSASAPARCRASTRPSSRCTRRRSPASATAGAALGSDAYFPFRDGVDQAAEAGVRAIVQPGGSVRDAEVIAAADEHGMAMVFTGEEAVPALDEPDRGSAH